MSSIEPRRATAILLAAGLSTRMNSRLPKAAHPIAGRPMLRHLIASCEQAFDRIVVVVGPRHGGRRGPGRAACGGGAARPPRHRPRRPAGCGAVRRRRRGCAVRRQPADHRQHPAPPARAPGGLGRRAGPARDAPPRPAALWPRGRAATAGSSASWSTPTSPTPSATRRCATPACCAPRPPACAPGSRRSGATMPRASST